MSVDIVPVLRRLSKENIHSSLREYLPYSIASVDGVLRRGLSKTPLFCYLWQTAGVSGRASWEIHLNGAQVLSLRIFALLGKLMRTQTRGTIRRWAGVRAPWSPGIIDAS